ncbi:hypothetical protein RclHR1_00840017 [Rhizophagus clarus]|uniref:BUB1 N-terminal domain-containing protein n=1 Tax=Rhizophagus clarus TaxID=94130 RepID=A0A2Z6S0T9_9GLOM|nr:hypothetical protein RclHR1_00840017 [Rhizophagus clarus]
MLKGLLWDSLRERLLKQFVISCKCDYCPTHISHRRQRSNPKEVSSNKVNVENEVTKKKRKLTKKQTERLKTCNNTFKIELENIDELDDSFDVYVRYIKWTMANYSQTPGSRSRLHQLLENASYRFHVENLKVLFAFLNRNEIGLNLAIYYEEYAEILEAMKCYNR